MLETGQASSAGLVGDKLYQKRARVALPILVRQARAGRTLFYSELAEELGMPNPRNLNYVLGAIGNEVLQLGEQWKSHIPPIQSLVVSKSTGLPGDGIWWFAPAAKGFKKATRIERTMIVENMQREVFAFERWDHVLNDCSLTSPPLPTIGLPSARTVCSGVTGGKGESEAHRKLKQAIAQYPELWASPDISDTQLGCNV